MLRPTKLTSTWERITLIHSVSHTRSEMTQRALWALEDVSSVWKESFSSLTLEQSEVIQCLMIAWVFPLYYSPASLIGLTFEQIREAITGYFLRLHIPGKLHNKEVLFYLVKTKEVDKDSIDLKRDAEAYMKFQPKEFIENYIARILPRKYYFDNWILAQKEK